MADTPSRPDNPRHKDDDDRFREFDDDVTGGTADEDEDEEVDDESDADEDDYDDDE
jgi:hypothetical protein